VAAAEALFSLPSRLFQHGIFLLDFIARRTKPASVLAILFGTIRIPGHFPLRTDTRMVSLKEAPHVSGDETIE
jgi:hypothetical protein